MLSYNYGHLFQPSVHLGKLLSILLDEQIKIIGGWARNSTKPMAFKGLELFHWHYSAKVYKDSEKWKKKNVHSLEDISW